MLEKREFEKNDFMWRVFAMLSLVSGAFSLLVFIMLIINYLQIRAADPVDNQMLTQMRIEYAALPDEDAALAQRIRDLDLLTRKAFFTTQEHLRIGAILLLIGVCTFMVSFKNMARWRPKRPELDETPTAEKEFLAIAESRNLITWAAVLLLGAGLASSYFTESALVPGVGAAVSEEGGPGAAEEAVAKVYPEWEALQQQWPSFRGAGATGIATFVNAPMEWDVESGKNIKWKVELTKFSTNSPVVWGEHLFMTSADDEAFEVHCYNTETGELRWSKKVEGVPGSPAELPEVTEDTGYASSTMVVHGDQVFAIFANADIVSYDFEGNLVWAKNLGVPENPYGYASSLLAYDNLLYVQMDQFENGKLIALNPENGDTAWTTAREEISWASPVMIHTEAGPQLVLVSEEDVDAYEPLTGKLIWRHEVLGGEVAPSPAYNNGILFAANEYAQSAAIEVKADGSSEVLWEYDVVMPEVSSPVGDGERFYFGTSTGELVCLDAKSGEELWLEELDDGFYSSPVLVGEHIFVSDIPGRMYILKASAEYEVVSTIEMGEDLFATPAFMDGRIYIRTVGHLYCIEAENG